jgi:hypothetical protein
LAQQRKARKVGRPKLPKGEAKGRIVPVRFSADDLKRIIKEAKADKQRLSEWIRRAVSMGETWIVVREDGKRVTFSYRELSQDQAEMTARVEGDEFTQLLKKSGLKLPLSHEDVQNYFAHSLPKT